MKRQKICIIGGNLTGLTTALALSKLDCHIDLITNNSNKNIKSNRTIAISENNFDFLNKLNISKSLKKEIWPCSVMSLYSEERNRKFLKIFHLDHDKKKEKILYILENSKVMKLMINKIKKIKSISVKNNKKISEIYPSGLLQSLKYNNSNYKYNLVIVCTGYNSKLVKNIFNGQKIESDYRESAVTTILNHNSIKNNIVRQIFLNNGTFALLPISNNKTSIVWSFKKDMKEKNILLKSKIKFYAKNYLKNISFATSIENKDLNFLIRNKYYSDRILLFGDALHLMHPFIGQGFNMTLRDLLCLEKILNDKINLGLDIGNADVLSEFSNEAKPRNFSFSLGSNLLKNALSFTKARNEMFKILDKSNVAKSIFFDVANKGFRF